MRFLRSMIVTYLVIIIHKSSSVRKYLVNEHEAFAFFHCILISRSSNPSLTYMITSYS